nr:MAG TPA: hypothetical protein [Caudoviricetes sp.]
MNNGRIRHATETFVNNLISGVKKLIESNTKQIEVLSSPYVIPEGTDIPVQERVKGKMYFKVTSRQSSGGIMESIKVSPSMGIKVQE